MNNAANILAGYTPGPGTGARTCWISIRPFVLETISCLPDLTSSTTRNYLHALTHFAAWALQEGIPLVPDVLLAPARIEQYTETATKHLVPHSRSTRRAMLRRIALASTTNAPWVPAPRPYPAKHLAKPYTPERIARYFENAEAQGSEFRTRVATAHLCLGLGVGLMSNEYMVITPGSLTVFGAAPVLEIRGQRPRMVPIHNRYLMPLYGIASAHPDEPFIGALSAVGAKDRLNNLLSKVKYPRGLPAPTTTRLRNTWMLRMLRSRLSLSEFMYFTGLGTTKALADLIPFIQTRDPYVWFQETAAFHD